MPAPLISIILPVCNAAPYLGVAIASLLRQDHAHFEIIAIDDGSTDGTLEILERHAAADKRIKVVFRENRGLIATLNEGLELARADLVARMDADDISYPNRLSMQAAAFEADPNLALCGTAYDEILGRRLLRSSRRQRLDQYDQRVLSLFFSLFAHSTIAFNRKVIVPDDLRYDPGYPSAEDFELVSRLAARYRVARIETSLLAYRRHAGSVSSRQRHLQQKHHLTLVAANLRRDRPVDPVVLEELGTAAMRGELSPELARRAAECLREIESAVERAEPGALPTYRVGVRNLFHDICCEFRDQDPMLLRVFLERTERRDWLRPADRLWLGVYGHSRVLGAAARRSVELAEVGWRRMRSVPLSSVLPDAPPPFP